jgi:glycosyltransferase involved in cell wall biosynthesis
MNISVLIPAYKPDAALVPFIKRLAGTQIKNVIVVDDGCGNEYRSIFSELKTVPKVVVLRHAENRGKGAALKTGFAYGNTQKPKIIGVVTADADGQHRVEDILKVAEALLESPDKLIMGARAFSGKVPLRSKIGNKATAILFRLLFRLKLTDTQTGLRGIPFAALSSFGAIPYNHYEYEAEMLLASSRMHLPIEEVPIETVYENNNASSHFNPIADSFRIYFVLLRYTFASLASVAVDFIVFLAAYPIIGNILWSIYTARAVSLFVNYGLNRRLVFSDKNHLRKTFPKYFALVIVSGYFASLLISYLSITLLIPVYLAKIISESGLYIVNFLIQKKMIFTPAHDNG